MKVVTFYLGPAVGLASRRFVIHPMPKAGSAAGWPQSQHPAYVYKATLAGTVTSVVVDLPDNGIYQAELRDYTTLTSAPSRIDQICFQTGKLQFPGPRSADRLQIYSMETESSSSASSSSFSVSSASSNSSSHSSQSSASSNSSSKSSQSSKSSLSAWSSASSKSSQSSFSLSSQSSQSSQSLSSQSSSSLSSQSSSSASGSSGLPIIG